MTIQILFVLFTIFVLLCLKRFNVCEFQFFYYQYDLDHVSYLTDEETAMKQNLSLKGMEIYLIMKITVKTCEFC